MRAAAAPEAQWDMRLPQRSVLLLSAALVGAILSAALLIGLTERVWRGETQRFDDAVRDRVDALMPGPKPFAHALSSIGSLDVLFVVSVGVCGVFVWRREYSTAVLLAVVMSGAFLIDLSMKGAVERLRPQHLKHAHSDM